MMQNVLPCLEGEEGKKRFRPTIFTFCSPLPVINDWSLRQTPLGVCGGGERVGRVGRGWGEGGEGGERVGRVGREALNLVRVPNVK